MSFYFHHLFKGPFPHTSHAELLGIRLWHEVNRDTVQPLQWGKPSLQSFLLVLTPSNPFLFSGSSPQAGSREQRTGVWSGCLEGPWQPTHHEECLLGTFQQYLTPHMGTSCDTRDLLVSCVKLIRKKKSSKTNTFLKKENQIRYCNWYIMIMKVHRSLNEHYPSQSHYNTQPLS